MNFGECLKKNTHKQTNKGCYPSIALNNSGLVVELSHKTSTNLMFYRVGRLKDDVIVWGVPSSAKPPKKKYFCSGAYPRVALNDDDTVVEVHKGELQMLLPCRRNQCGYHADSLGAQLSPEHWPLSRCRDQQ